MIDIIGIYIHIPFCVQKCKYCDFCSYPSMLNRQTEYCQALMREAHSYANRRICADTVYFGGGTPSLISAKNLFSVLESVDKNFHISSDAEITLEANPSTINAEKAKLIKSAGINRISLGAQSFVDSELKTLGRVHSSDEIRRSYYILRDAGFKNISLDLMYAIVGQDTESLTDSISQLLKLNPEHISCYGLKIEEDTPFYDMLCKGEIVEKSDDEYADMYDILVSSLVNAGYSQYELSNFSKPGFESKHNLKYWTGCEYVGLGAAAASYYDSRRYTHTANFDKYIKSFANDEEYELTKEDLMSEYMFLSLRLTRIGALKSEFQRRFSKSIDQVFGDSIGKHVRNGSIIDKGDRYVLAPKCYYISNSVLCDFV